MISSVSARIELKMINPYFDSLVKITGYTSATAVTAEVIGQFQDVATGVDTDTYVVIGDTE